MNSAFDTEYQASLQMSALNFLQRHQGEYLGNDQSLFRRAIQHLVNCFEMPWHQAEKLVSKAYNDLTLHIDRHQLDIDGSSANVAVITDPATGRIWSVPVSLIYQHIITALQIADSAS